MWLSLYDMMGVHQNRFFLWKKYKLYSIVCSINLSHEYELTVKCGAVVFDFDLYSPVWYLWNTIIEQESTKGSVKAGLKCISTQKPRW